MYIISFVSQTQVAVNSNTLLLVPSIICRYSSNIILTILLLAVSIKSYYDHCHAKHSLANHTLQSLKFLLEIEGCGL